VRDRGEKEIPPYNVPINSMGGGYEFARAYIHAGQPSKGKPWLEETFKNAEQYVKWYLSLNDNRFNQSTQDCMNNLFIMNKCIEIADVYGEKYSMDLQERYLRYGEEFKKRSGYE
jgi:hypothetical protein